MAYVPDGTSRGGFCLDIDEVTVDSYKNCVKSGRCTTPKMNPEDDYCNYKRGDRGLHPINCVTFDQAMAYCTGVGRRLPGDAEWETAASGGGQRQPYVWGQEDPERSDLCWEENRGAHSCEVGSFPKDVTVHGIHDMAGNVREWTIGPEQTRYVRGGAWNFDGKRSVRIASREANPWSSRGRIIGFRCASEHL
jgi:formylglycine-generating enzyme required for sulfatase activity